MLLDEHEHGETIDAFHEETQRHAFAEEVEHSYIALPHDHERCPPHDMWVMSSLGA